MCKCTIRSQTQYLMYICYYTFIYIIKCAFLRRTLRIVCGVDHVASVLCATQLAARSLVCLRSYDQLLMSTSHMMSYQFTKIINIYMWYICIRLDSRQLRCFTHACIAHRFILVHLHVMCDCIYTT